MEQKEHGEALKNFNRALHYNPKHKVGGFCTVARERILDFLYLSFAVGRVSVQWSFNEAKASTLLTSLPLLTPNSNRCSARLY